MSPPDAHNGDDAGQFDPVDQGVLVQRAGQGGQGSSSN